MGTAYNKGYADFGAGYSILDNPFTPQSFDWEEWRIGYLDAKANFCKPDIDNEDYDALGDNFPFFQN